MRSQGRAGRLAELLGERKVDLLLVAHPPNLRYLTGFTGSNGLALIAAAQPPAERTTPSKDDRAEIDRREGDRPEGDRPETGRSGLARQRFLTDFRYETQAAAQVPEQFERRIVAIDLLDAAAGELAEGSSGGRLGFDDAHVTVKQHARLLELLGDGWELIRCAGLVEELREVKDPGELARIQAAAELADEALREVLEAGLIGRTEREVAIDLELRMRRLGAEAPSFPSIVAAGPHSALPHAEPRDVAIPPDTLVTIDWGAQLEGYCSDCTRTYATGPLPTAAREVYELVLSAQLEGLQALRPGPTGRDVDAIAREVIEQAGHGDHFGHGLGHGVGLEVHEPPRLSRTAPDQPLRPGNVVTVEPGIYLPGRFGVRIEDLAAVTDDGHRVLNGLPKELTAVS